MAKWDSFLVFTLKEHTCRLTVGTKEELLQGAHSLPPVVPVIPSSAAQWNNLWRAGVIYHRHLVNLLHLLVLQLLIHFCCQSMKRAQDSALSPPGCISELQLLGFFWLFAFPFSNPFIHFHQICVPLPILYLPLILHFLLI